MKKRQVLNFFLMLIYHYQQHHPPHPWNNIVNVSQNNLKNLSISPFLILKANIGLQWNWLERDFANVWEREWCGMMLNAKNRI